MQETVHGSLRRRRFVVLVASTLLVGVIGTGAAVAQLGGAQEQKIILKSLKFTPNKITITKTTKVSFIWKESVAHNVVFDSKSAASKVKAALEARLLKYFGKPTCVVVRTASEMAAILEANPFPHAEPKYTYAIFLDKRPPSWSG